MKKINSIIMLLMAFNLGFGQTTLVKGDLAIIGVNTDNEDFTFVLRTDITTGTTIYFSDELVNVSGTGLIGITEGVVLFTASTNYVCGTIISYNSHNAEFTSVNPGFMLANGGDEVLAFQGYDGVTYEWTTFLHANIETTLANFPVGFTAADIVDGTDDNREYTGSILSPSWTDLNAISNYVEGEDYNAITLGTSSHSCSPCPTTTTWNGVNWSAGLPNVSKNAVINGAYTTATDGSFSACSLTITSGELTIDDNYYVEVENDLTVDIGGKIQVQPYGAFIQNNDLGIVTNNGDIKVDKLTAILDNWYEYTYWSSPVSNTTIDEALSDSNWYRRFIFNANQFNDESAETNNDNNLVFGIQDDIDDEGDDWQWVHGSTTMTPGVGYAATHSQSAYLFATNYRYTFEGDFNNGVITVPVERNDITNADSNPNLIGNPYPSAIDISAFIAQNMYPAGPLEGDILFWSQNTDASATANGNETFNFSTNDYARHNGVGGTVGGDRLTPNGFIPSGQAFFVNFSDSYGSTSANVVFNNSMRSLTYSPDNSQFFKNSESKKSESIDNKLWVNLTSDNGVFNQILVGYVDGATDNDDGSFYDSHKIVAPKAYSALYSLIDSIDKKFVIQGKAVNSLNEDEIIKIGFKTNIEVATLYTLSLPQIEGDFLNSNTIYLKDNLLNKVHDLSNSDYTFTSEVGVFNDRFEIMFNGAALSIDNGLVDSSSLKIIELDNDEIQFSVPNAVKIKSVEIYDLLGRTLYNFKGNNSSETFRLNKLNSSIFVAKVELTNGTVLSKKAIKN